MKKLTLLLSLLLMANGILLAQVEEVGFFTRTAAPMRKFIYHEPSKFEKVNGLVNVAFSSSNGYTIEINGIKPDKLKCGSILKASDYQVVLIDHSMERTYLSHKDDYRCSIAVVCTENNQLRLLLKGNLFWEKIKIYVTATFQGVVGKNKNIHTTPHD